MKINFIALKEKFLEDGFITINDTFNKDLVDELTDEINNCNDALKYFDNKNILRRVEKIYDKGKQLKILNDKILILLKNIFNEEFLIFKDKFNAKPPSGEGFFAHYDGVFHFLDENNNKKNGWYEYGDYFINVLIALDECNLKNGALEIAKAHKGNFNELLKNTKNDGTPAITKEIESNTSFDLICLNAGDIVIFSNTCPHRSKQNTTNKDRRVLYYTYSLKKNGDKYQEYFENKKQSTNSSKALADK